MSQYYLSADADSDLDAIYHDGLVTYGEHQADKFFGQLLDALDLIVEFPLKGVSVQNLYPQLRRSDLKPYSIYYMPRDYGVYIVRVYKQVRLVPLRLITGALRQEEDVIVDHDEEGS